MLDRAPCPRDVGADRADLACPSPLLDDLHAKFPTGALATLAAPTESWRGLGHDCAELVAFVRPRDLER